ncbi:LOW QUALITY PROTEIN: DNA repair protein RAD50 [Selaginella moellendorffii]|uniref:LOW QUALITY PROTEIN: DNA repair protein RAD50 n=1 Tax=Selaginella moellendorffii TaxID=88036 RepID=UPI000D1CE234|nr:LOW QUALITY PROTEIN: DNA repair protein RAD50 [Selaginella moellendorffii]|eukprot:XP_024524767.1 LOW QUALITY PROTEIN: DNA repair protein RAD50 [Selaginella moellendorffii]
MSTLDKMLIKGIRSFGPDNTHVITFYRPLTLVVGANGAGKTTIIECLKNACTGELPPNARSGQSFIHDPKVDGQTETKGQIKLRFRTASGKDVVCIRSFQLTQKASKMEYKAIESVLQTINTHTGEKVCLSYRCADMDREVPALMGVSKAILENVIFVHQDEANWPLSEASVLKKKFDDIFSATRYTKALDVIKKLHKDQTQEIKMQKLKLENVQTLKDAAYKLQETIDGDQQKTKQLQDLIAILTPKIQAAQAKINSLEGVLEEIRQLQKEINFKDGVRTSVLKAKTEQYNALEEENEDSDEDLAEWQEKFHERIAQSNKEICDLQRSLDAANTQYDTLSELIAQASTQVGKFEGEENAHLQDKKQCDALIQQLFDRYKLGNLVLPLDEQATERSIARITNRLEDLKQDHAKLTRFHEKELATFSKKLDDVNQKYSDASGRKDGKIGQKRSIEKRIDELRTTFRDTSTLEGELRRSAERAASMDTEVKRMQRKMDDMNFDELISEERKNKLGIEQKIRSLPVKSDVELTFGNISKAYDELLDRSRDADMRVAQARAMLDDAKSTLAKQQEEKEAKRKLLISRLYSLFQQDLNPSSYPSKLRELSDARDSSKSQHDMADGMRRMFDPFERIARATHACPCCERPFATPEEEDEFVDKQRVKRSSTAQRLHELASLTSIADNKFQQLDKLRPLFEEYQKLESQGISATEKSISDMTMELERSTETQNDVSCLLAQSKAELGLVTELRITAQSIEEAYTSVQNLEREVRTLENQLNPESSLRSPDDVGEELEKHEKQLEELNRKLDRLKEEHDYMKDDLANCKQRKHAEEMKKADLEKKLERNKALKEEEASLVKQMNQIDTEIQFEMEQLEPLAEEKERHLKEFDQLKRKFRQEQDVSTQGVNDFDKEVHSLTNIWGKIKDYVERHKTHNVQTAKRRLSELQAQKDEEESKKSFCLAEVQRVNNVLAQQKVIERNIADNIKYRKLCAEEQKCIQEIKALEERMLAIGNTLDFEGELKKALKEKQHLMGEESHHKGTIAVHESNIARNKTDLKQPQYKNIDKRYRAQLIQLKTMEMANKDLDKYYNALDRALMRFHTMKMEEINKIIKELWQQTYRGQDIDFIEIRADAEGTGTRSYSYRVVMRAGGAELEMRGRCSAGQKVLAALIIRLALAETFCLNCGILTLDEPTTNLDAQNAESFAAALLRIMEERRGQENFQLIVITHDERFAQLIGQRQLTEKYYRVSKDERQHSLIEVQEIFG